jgi:hypothetical protein
MPSNHTSVAQMTSSCDQCHRTYAWLPASWNHVGVTPGSCANSGCHVSGSNQYYREKHAYSYNLMRNNNCDDCHNVVSWIPRHMAQTKTCSGCHNTLDAIGKPPTHGVTTAECNTCHTNTVTWLGASYHNGATAGNCGTCHGTTPGVMGKPAGSAHIPTTGNNCDLCHSSLTSFAVYKMNHAGNGNTSSCVACHATGSPYPVSTKITTGSTHNGSTAGQECANCHASTSTWLGAAGAMPTWHISYTPGVPCSNCHVSGYTAKVNITTLHNNSNVYSCADCHIKPNLKANTQNGQQVKSSHGNSNCTSCHKQAATYTNWSE